jgi:hypothetical protein
MKHDILEASCASEMSCFIEELENGQSPEKEDYISDFYECFFLIHYSTTAVCELNSFLKTACKVKTHKNENRFVIASCIINFNVFYRSKIFPPDMQSSPNYNT